MDWIDDEISYPWHAPVARDLHRRLIEAFDEPVEIRALVRSARRPNASKIAFGGRSVHQIWVDTLDRASSEGALRALLTRVLAESDRSSRLELATFLRGLLAEATECSTGQKIPPGTALVDSSGRTEATPGTGVEASVEVPEGRCECTLAGECDCHLYHVTERCECSFCVGR